MVEHRVAKAVMAWALAASLAEGSEPPSSPRAPVDPEGEAVLATFLSRPAVAPDTADLVRVEGALARAPSFWVKHVEVSRHYARVRGHRVVVRMESVAQIRFVGRSHLVVTYDYEMIDGQAIPPSSVLAAVVPATPAFGP